ncbi:GTP cyclohydrolase II [Lactiplantibacillus mudanjiangensis]|uniref:Multifunctional fusion protein n=1 Tax=Lactiplantibacillus mudanjiangensis TaxID=1296538 RepID=A0A660DVH3_9LACO|nr:GTP cyclohydrolase II [Lactiplantibacillus mudanjiangensis]VDG26178.1 GTP cyclohydrolase II [Lactobacillus plantarum JDM1] [Lactiplantibacillus mudanjiangensis]VDG27330.1 GTP cyclohydrolase II [Lactobacillus plantarum JDM1] [Lactiplantibacillus mudanjiangensis]
MSIESKVEAALAVLKQGGLIIVADDESREAEGDMVGLAEFATTETVNRMITSARGLLCLPVAPTIAERLYLDLMTTKSHDAFGTAFTVSLDHHTTTTGISAADRATTIRHVADPTSQPDDFYHPGHMFPLIARAGGVLERRGHTEAAVDLAKLAGVTPAAYICEIVKKNGLMARRKELKALAEGLKIPMITVADIAAYRVRQTQPTLTQLDPVKLPTVHGQFNLTGMQLPGENQLQLALQLGNLNTDEPVLVRLHSECLTGDVFGSQRCDCGQQLQTALQTIGDQGRGLLLYLRQEGRGIGLANKLRAYHLQEQGVDTYDANVQLGLPADARRYDQAAVMLHALGITKIRLMTNNLDKVDQLTAYGIDVVERVPLEIPANEHDAAYLKTKRDKFHHQLSATL